MDDAEDFEKTRQAFTLVGKELGDGEKGPKGLISRRRKLSNVLLGLPSFISWWGSPLAPGEYLLLFILPQPAGSQTDGVELLCPFLTIGFER